MINSRKTCATPRAPRGNARTTRSLCAPLPNSRWPALILARCHPGEIAHPRSSRQSLLGNLTRVTDKGNRGSNQPTLHPVPRLPTGSHRIEPTIRSIRVRIEASETGYPSCEVNRANSAASDSIARLIMVGDMVMRPSLLFDTQDADKSGLFTKRLYKPARQMPSADCTGH